MDNAGISIHELAVYRALKGSGGWMTNAEIGAAVEAAGTPVSGRTVRLHTARLVEAGVVERAAVFPGHRFKAAARVPKSGKDYLARLLEADEVFD